MFLALFSVFVIGLSACSTDNDTTEQQSAKVLNTEEKKLETAKPPESDNEKHDEDEEHDEHEKHDEDEKHDDHDEHEKQDEEE